MTQSQGSTCAGGSRGGLWALETIHVSISWLHTFMSPTSLSLCLAWGDAIRNCSGGFLGWHPALS